MRARASHLLCCLGVLSTTMVAGGAASAASIEFNDPKGDDNGPGAYIYPTDVVYKKGSFDLTRMKIKEKGKKLEISLQIAVPFEDPWDSARWPAPGNGFSLQMFQIYVDTDGKAGSGETKTLPGMNATFDKDSAWEKVILISPQNNKRLASEIDQKAKAFKDKIILPKSVKVKGKEVIAVIDKKAVGGKLKANGWQVLVSSNEGYPKGKDLLSRRVNEYEGAHRFGGGDDGASDPHFVDVLAGAAEGKKDEVDAQHKMLAFDAAKKQKASLKMVRR